MSSLAQLQSSSSIDVGDHLKNCSSCRKTYGQVDHELLRLVINDRKNILLANEEHHRQRALKPALDTDDYFSGHRLGDYNRSITKHQELCASAEAAVEDTRKYIREHNITSAQMQKCRAIALCIIPNVKGP